MPLLISAVQNMWGRDKTLIAESGHPFKIVEDRGFLSLMKMGRPGYYIPAATTVSQDAKLVFAQTQERLAKLLKVRLIWLQQKTDKTTHQGS